jgi:hypothetical protein
MFETETIESLVKRYLEFAVTEVVRGKARAATTMTSYRRALEGVIAAVNKLGVPLSELPENFITEHWMPTQASIINQPVQLRIRAVAVKNFVNWLKTNNVTVAPLIHPDLPTPAPKPKEPAMSNNVHEIGSLSDASLNDNAVPAAPQSSYSPPAMPTAVPPPMPRVPVQQAAPRAQARREENPLAAMMSQPPGYMLRVRRERDGDEPVYINDFKAEKVRIYGAVEPFLIREVGPRLAASGITGDVTFIVCAVAPGGTEGEMRRVTVSCLPAGTQQAPQPAPVAPMAMPPQADVADMVATATTVQRRALDEVEERLSKHLAPQQGQNSEMSELKNMVMSLAGSVRQLSEQVSSRDSRRRDEFQPEEVEHIRPHQAPQLDITKIVEMTVNELKKANAPAQPVSSAPTNGLGEMMNMMAQAKEMFQPQNIQVDTSPLEQDLRDLRKQLTDAKKDDISDMVVKFKAMKELFTVVGGETSAPKPTGFGAALGSLVTRIVENPTPLAEAAERVLNAASSLRSGASPQQTQNQLPQGQKKQSFPQPVLDAAKVWSEAKGGQALVVAGHDLFGKMAQVPELREPVTKMSDFIKKDEPQKFAIYMRQLLGHFGIQVPADRIAQMAEEMFVVIHRKEDEDDEEQEDIGPADLTVRVGGASSMEASDEQDEQDEDEDVEGDEDEGEDTEEDAEEDEPADEQGQLEDIPPAADLPPPAVTATVENVVPLDEPPAEKKSRKRKDEREVRPPARG